MSTPAFRPVLYRRFGLVWLLFVLSALALAIWATSTTYQLVTSLVLLGVGVAAGVAIAAKADWRPGWPPSRRTRPMGPILVAMRIVFGGGVLVSGGGASFGPRIAGNVAGWVLGTSVVAMLGWRARRADNAPAAEPTQDNRGRSSAARCAS